MPQIGAPPEASRAALKTLGVSSRLPLTSLMMVDLAARAFAEAESGFRVRARMVKLALESEARIVSMTFLPCLPVAPSTRRGLVELMIADVNRKELEEVDQRRMYVEI